MAPLAQVSQLSSVEQQSQPHSGVFGIGAALPKRAVHNDELSTFLDTSDGWIWERVGVRSRNIAGPDESTVSLAYEASLGALAQANIDASEIDNIIVATITPDKSLPSAATMVQDRLGIANAMSFDIQAACTGFLYALTLADSLQRTHGFKNSLVIGAETLSRIVDWEDRSTCVLFGDGAGAMVLSAQQNQTDKLSDTYSGIIAVDMHAEGQKWQLINRPGGAYPLRQLPESIVEKDADTGSPYMCMNGREVFKNAVISMSNSVNTVLAQAGLSIDDIDHFVPHQSNQRIIDSLCERIGLQDKSKLVLNIDTVANTSAASIPIAFEEVVRAGNVNKGDLVLMTAVGAGLTYGSILLRW